jgi:hypothetical protein
MYIYISRRITWISQHIPYCIDAYNLEQNCTSRYTDETYNNNEWVDDFELTTLKQIKTIKFN